MAPLSKEQESRMRKAGKDYRLALKAFTRCPEEDTPEGLRKLNRLGDKMEHAGTRLRGITKMIDGERDQDEDYLVYEFLAYLPERSSRTKKRLRPAPAVRVMCSDKMLRDLRIDEIFLID